MTRKKTGAQLEHEITEALARRTAFDPFKDLDKRSRLALRQALQSGSGAAPTQIVKGLERKGLAVLSGHVHESKEWGKVVRRWPSFWLTSEGKKVAQEIVDKLHSTGPDF